MKKVDITGKKFGRLTAIEPTDRRHSGSVVWLCKCDCGKDFLRSASKLLDAERQRALQSCGCFKSGVLNRKHGMYGSSTYVSWNCMMSRCTNPNVKHYDIYSKVPIDPKWLTFEGFFEDMGERPPGTTLDRYPNPSGPYTKSNCRWATPLEQARNKTGIIIVEYEGVEMPLTEAAEKAGLKPRTVRARMYKGWPKENLFDKTRS